MDTNHGARILTAAVAALVLLPVVGQAQERHILISDLPLAEQVRIRAETEAREGEAGNLFGQARQAEKQGDWRKAARLYEESAGLRSEGPHLGAVSYDLAGRAYYYSGQLNRASRMFEEAGNRALIVGDVIGAARSYMHAAVVAQENGKRLRAADIGWKAYRLTESEHLSPQERDLIRQHLDVVEGMRS